MRINNSVRVISIHALCEEGDTSGHSHQINIVKISIHALCEEGDIMQGLNLIQGKNISIHALCEEGDQETHKNPHDCEISIHALCEEGDMPCRPCTERP